MPDTLSYRGTLEVTSCWCGIRLAIPASLNRQLEQNGHVVFCPLGHEFTVTETELDRERKRVADLASTLERARQQATAERDLRRDTERRLAAQKGATTRAKKRAAAAVCPVEGCGRSFVQLRRHMQSKHPDYVPGPMDDHDKEHAHA